MLKKKELIERLEKQVKQLRPKVDAFTKKVADPNERLTFHLRWSRDIFAHAAKLEVFEAVITILHGDDFNEKHYEHWIEKYLMDRVLRDATRVSSSSSETANLIETEEDAAWATVYEIIRRGF